PDSSGGALFVWQPQTQSGEPDGKGPIMAQRISPDGHNSWQSEGAPVVGIGRIRFLDDAVADGSGGAIVTWLETEGGLSAPGTVWGQRLDHNGNRLWGDNGRPVFGSPGAPPETTMPESSTRQTVTTTISNVSVSSTYQTVLKDDGAGSALLLVAGLPLRAQMIGASGDVVWIGGGVPVWQGSAQAFRIASFGLDGSIVVWSQTFGLTQAQRLDGSGNGLWEAGGVAVTTDKNVNFFNIIAEDGGNGGTLVAWGEGKDVYNIQQSYIQRLDAQGNRLWGNNGIRLDK
ncbi:MAG: hypothetical protein Q8R28_00780, partial [Dehalococcoidia bacterium]|nr:hypothetical protein [Dehalococcoidia bacterium]